MERTELDDKILSALKSILTYCISRTSCRQDAEDLSQDIILQIYKSSTNIRDDKAFYGFLWAVADNVYKQWLYKKSRNNTHVAEIDENISDNSPTPDSILSYESDIYRLRRELTLLSEKYRSATVLYYINGKSCAEIATILSISESMVKYLLFKARKIIGEGITMERNYGTSSYNPRRLTLKYWGESSNYYNNITDDIISQNILFACYNDKLTAEQISLEIGVALPYMESDLSQLVDYDLLCRDGKKYYTNIIIFTSLLDSDIFTKTSKLRREIADIIKAAIDENEDKIRHIGSYGFDMSRDALRWQCASIIIRRAVIDKLQASVNIEYPVNKFGTSCFVWGKEINCLSENHDADFSFGISNTSNERGNNIIFMDFTANGDMVHHYFYRNRMAVRIFCDIALGNTDGFSDNDLGCAAEMIERGYIIKNDNKLSVNVPVLTREDYNTIISIFDDYCDNIVNLALALLDSVSEIIRSHTPLHLRKCTGGMAFLHLFDDAISAPMKLLYNDGYLQKPQPGDILPTTYLIL